MLFTAFIPINNFDLITDFHIIIIHIFGLPTAEHIPFSSPLSRAIFYGPVPASTRLDGDLYHVVTRILRESGLAV